MTGMTNYTANNWAAYITGQIPMPALTAVYLALFTAVGTDAGTGFTEVTGGAYARVQVAGRLTTNAATATTSPTISAAAVPAWIVAGMSVYDVTTGAAVGTVSSTTSTTVTLTANASSAVASGDTLAFSAFPAATGTAPSTDNNGAIITFPAATADWTNGSASPVIAFALMDAATAGNMLLWDFLGNYPWLPFEMASGGNTATVKANGYASNDPIVFSTEYGGTFPTLSTGTFTGYTVNFVATPATDIINVDTTSGPATPVVTTSSGSGMVRKITRQSIPSGVTASFAANQFTISVA